jgi:hypothetical protein
MCGREWGVPVLMGRSRSSAPQDVEFSALHCENQTTKRTAFTKKIGATGERPTMNRMRSVIVK